MKKHLLKRFIDIHVLILCAVFFFLIINMAYVIDMKQKLLIMLTFRTTVEIKKRYTEKTKENG